MQPLSCLAAAALAAFLALVPQCVEAQALRGPGPSILRSTPAAPAAPDSTSSRGWTASKGAVVGGLVGAAAGAAFGAWVCHQVGSSGSDRGCSGTVLWYGGAFSILGVLLGALAGHDAES